MGDRFQIQLSSKEILITAALLGYESVFGVDDGWLFGKNVDMKSIVRQQVRRLERKKLIRYDLDGVLYIVPELRKSIDCICKAESVGLFSTNLKSGKRTSVYVMEKENMVVTLERLSDGKYVMQLAESLPLEEIIPQEILSSQYQEMKEMLLLEEAEYVHKQIEEFNHDDAKMRIQKHVNDSDAGKMIETILSGSCRYMNVQIYRKKKELYNAIYNTLLVNVDNCMVKLSADENRVLCFESIPPVNVMEQIRRQFKVI